MEKELVITLKSVPYQDRSRVLTGLSEKHGKISAIARNSVQSKRFGPALDLFSASYWEWRPSLPQREMIHLERAEGHRSFHAFSKDYPKFILASIMAEFILRLSLPGETSSESFRLLSNGFTALEEATTADPRILTAFLSKALQIVGASPLFHQCEGCKKKLVDMKPEEDVMVLVETAMILCKDCSPSGTNENHPVSVVYDFMKAREVPIRKMSEHFISDPKKHHPFIKMIERFFVYHVTGFDRVPIQSLGFLS